MRALGDWCGLAIPPGDVLRREGVAQIVNPWQRACAGGSDTDAKLSERLVYRCLAKLLAVAVHEKMFARELRAQACAEVALQGAHGGWMQR